jgi:Flp pilus assembly protein TadG
MSNRVYRGIRDVLRQAERGEDTSFEFTVAMVPLTMMILIIAFTSIVRSAQMPLWSATSECARMAVATEIEATGRARGEEAARALLEGYFIKPGSVQVNITGDWTPDSVVTCRVSYDIDVSGIAGFAELTGGRVPMSAEVSLRVETHKSQWR